jgi:hypothetical protein
MLHDVSLTFMHLLKADKVTKFCGALPTKSKTLRSSQRLCQAFSVHSASHAARKVQSKVLDKRPKGDSEGKYLMHVLRK